MTSATVTKIILVPIYINIEETHSRLPLFRQPFLLPFFSSAHTSLAACLGGDRLIFLGSACQPAIGGHRLIPLMEPAQASAQPQAIMAYRPLGSPWQGGGIPASGGLAGRGGEAGCFTVFHENTHKAEQLSISEFFVNQCIVVYNYTKKQYIKCNETSDTKMFHDVSQVT